MNKTLYKVQIRTKSQDSGASGGSSKPRIVDFCRSKKANPSQIRQYGLNASKTINQ